LYGNTHTNTSISGSQSTAFVAEARQIIAEECGAKITGKASRDVVLFAGNGATSCVELLIDVLGIRGMNMTKHMNASEDAGAGAGAGAGARGEESEGRKGVVFCGPYEHHSNLLPWRESGCEIVMIRECPTTHNVDLVQLENKLQQYQYQRDRDRDRYHPGPDYILMGAFSAASNVTGKISPVDEIAVLLHQYNALAFFDYATGAPYLPINMNPSIIGGEKDAVMISPHKMMGGVQTPGILILKKHLVHQTLAPRRSGGGTVFYVTHTHHRFLSNRIERFEGGTPNIVGIVRSGLTFLVKRRMEMEFKNAVMNANANANANGNGNGNIPRTIAEYEMRFFRQAKARLQKSAPNLILLGTHNDDDGDDEVSKKLPIFSFLIKVGPRFLHYNYVCAILNDLFGIQSRGGCQCAGPYSQRLLGLTTIEGEAETPNEVNARIEHMLLYHKERAELLRPGFTRLSLPFKGVSSAEVEYTLQALEWVSKYGWVFLPQYRCNHRTGEWRHSHRQGKPLGRERKWLSHYNGTSISASLSVSVSEQKDGKEETLEEVLERTFQNANVQLTAARKNQRHIAQALKMTHENELPSGSSGGAEGASGGKDNDNDDLDVLRWYVSPRECALYLQDEIIELPPQSTSFAKEDVKGALRPEGFMEAFPVEYKFSTPTPAPLPSSSLEGKVEVDVKEIQMEVREEKTTTATDVEMKNDNDSINDPNDIVCEGVVTFREGEHHSGEAHMDDIVDGYNDGELSARCELYISELDEWIIIEEVLKRRRRPKNAPESMEVEDPMPKPQVIPLPAPAAVKMMEGKSASREKKKPSRDSSAWGKASTASSQPLPTSVSASASASNDISKKLDSEKVKNELAQVQKQKRQQQKHHKQQSSSKKGKKTKHIKPPPKMMRYCTQAMIQWDMIKEGDRLLLGLSGGKDSLTLLHCLLEFQRKLPIKFEFEVCTIDPMTPSFDPSPLIPYCILNPWGC